MAGAVKLRNRIRFGSEFGKRVTALGEGEERRLYKGANVQPSAPIYPRWKAGFPRSVEWKVRESRPAPPAARVTHPVPQSTQSLDTRLSAICRAIFFQLLQSRRKFGVPPSSNIRIGPQASYLCARPLWTTPLISSEVAITDATAKMSSVTCK